MVQAIMLAAGVTLLLMRACDRRPPVRRREVRWPWWLSLTVWGFMTVFVLGFTAFSVSQGWVQ